ncbi:jumonji, AT rich interactive domain 2 isoform X2 [Choristoneura fumiferana]|uniref:jumonji, AT rich interactive domain 2 isoform X2 n=1 Tax=Choristoneura fumiferana TaxID=7141 RepID=UPI003D15CA5C
MKQSCAMRLVQRKFAQGVPIPPSISVPPPAPERKPDKEDQRTVYHNGMSARSLLDIVALQNVHRHKQPMVLLERLREDEIPVTVPTLKVKKRQLAFKAKKKNNSMCLRPRDKPKPEARVLKRKAAAVEVAKSPSKKRPCVNREDKSEDDMPLLYLSSTAKETPPEKKKEGSFTFKCPSSKSIVSRKFKRSARRISILSAGRPLPSPLPSPIPSAPFKTKAIVRRSSRRAGAPAPPSPAVRATRRPRQSSVKPKRKVIIPARLNSTDQPTSLEKLTSESIPAPAKTAATDRFSPTISPPPAVRAARRVSTSIQNKPVKRKEKIASLARTKSTDQSPLPEPRSEKSIPPETAAAEEHSVPEVEVAAPPVNGDDDDKSDIINLYYDSDSELEVPAATPQAVGPETCPSNRYNSVQDVVVASNAKCQFLAARCRNCRGCGIVEKIIQLTRLMQPACITAGDVYDFNAELVEAISPSLSCLRNQSRQARAVEEESHLFMDLLPQNSQHIIQITLKRTAESQCISKACIVNRDVMANTPQPSLIEHENLLDRLLECVSAASQSQHEKEEPQPSTSTSFGPAGLPDVIRPALRACTVNLGEQFPEKPDSSSDVDDSREAATDSRRVLDAPVFYPTKEEFTDPIGYYEKIAPTASKFGLCKIVAPAGFAPPCVMNEQFRFAVIYQYISKLYSRWGPASRELAAIKAHMKTQSVVFPRSPLLDGSEVNLPKLHHSVQRNGGPTNVIQRKRWGRVAEEMKLTKLQNPERKLDQLFMRYLLPYTMLSNQERQKKMAEVEKCWTVKYQKMLERARNPFHRQKRLLGESESSEDEAEDNDTAGALDEAEDCIVQGRIMNLATFKKIATSLMEAHFEAGTAPTAAAVEAAYWRAVLHGTEHIVANTASIDTGEEGYGFPKDPAVSYGDHPWNLKRLSQNPGNVLRFLGPVLGVTVPTLHLGMLFSTSCWHRDPHGLPWTEFMHSGPEKIWYGIPSGQSANFRSAVETLCPAYCQSKSIWLASDIAMIPPDILAEHNVTLSRATQQPGEYIIVFPEAHSCSITTGFAVSESVYFASSSWLDNVYQLFKELRNSCEPTMFSLEQLLVSGGGDRVAPRRVLPAVLATLVGEEMEHRRNLERRGLQLVVQISEPDEESQSQAWTARNQDECEFCRSTLYFSKVIGLTGKKSLVCPEHAIRLLDTQKYREVNVKSLGFVTRYSTKTLQELWLECNGEDENASANK